MDEFRLDLGWKEIGLKRNSDWVWTADACMCYMRQLIKLVEEGKRVLITAENLEKDLDVLYKHRALLHAYSAEILERPTPEDVNDLPVERVIPREALEPLGTAEEVVRTPIVVPV